MASVLKDRVQETTATAGTGSLTVAGAVAGYVSFSSVMAIGDTTLYCIVDPVANAWETGTATYTAANTLSRVVSASSNANALVSLAGNAGTLVFADATAAFLVTLASLTGAAFTGPVSVPTLAVGDTSTNAANASFVSSMVDGVAPITTTGGTSNLTPAQFGTAIWLITGALTSNSVLVVPGSGAFTACNRTTGLFTVTIKTANGTGVVVGQGLNRNLVSDGTNVVPEMTDFTGESFHGVQVGLTAAQFPAWRVFQRTTLTGGTYNKGRGSIPVPIVLTLPAGCIEYRLRDSVSASVLQDWTPCSYNVMAGASTVTCYAVPAYLGWYFLDIRANQDSTQIVLGTNKIGMGRIIGAGGQSEIVRIFGRMDGQTDTIASLGITINPNSSCLGSYTDIIRSVAVAAWGPPADGTAYDSSACAELLRLQVGATGVTCALVGFGFGGSQISTWLQGGANWNVLQANLGAAGSAYEAFVWCQGASDNATDETTYRTSLSQFYVALDAANTLGPAVHIDSHMQGINVSTFGTFVQNMAIRRAHQLYAFQHPVATVYVPISDVDTCLTGTNTGVEISMAGYVVAARHWHRAMRPKLGLTGVGDVGPTMGKPTLATATITIPITQAGGTALTGVGSWWTKFRVYAAGTTATALTVSSGTLSATAITLTLSATPAGAVDVYFDPNPSGTNTNSSLMVYDNNTAADGDGLSAGRPLMHNGAPLNTAALAAATAITLASPTYDTTTQKFGTAALNGGTGTIPYTAIPQTTPYTYECFVKTVAPGTATQAFFGGGTVGWVGLDTNGYIIGAMGSGAPSNTTAKVADGNWHHVAITVLSTTSILIFLDGVVVVNATGLAGWAIPTTGAFGVRQYDSSGGGTIFAGEIDELVISSIAKYVGPFTPPTAPATGAEFGSYAVYHLDSSGAGIV